MQYENQGRTQQDNNLFFYPRSTSISNVGTTVNYGIGSNTTVTAWNPTTINSGTVNTTGTANTMCGTTTVSAQNNVNTWSGNNITRTRLDNLGFGGTTPTVTANQLTNQSSGAFAGVGTTTQFKRDLVVQPSIDISETSSDIIVSAFVPDGSVHNMNLNVTENSVTISGYMWTGNENLVLNRTVALPTSIKAEMVDANMQSGVLEIRLPKTEKEIRRKTTLNIDSTKTK